MDDKIAVIRLEEAMREYVGTEFVTKALDCVNFTVNQGEFVAIVGPSGAGKSTLLQVIGCMDFLTSGQYWLMGNPIHEMKRSKIIDCRNDYISFVFQNFALMDRYTVYENVELPLIAKNIRGAERKERIRQALEKLNIAELAKKKPPQLSGGQQQRVAIARALAADSEIILADEPTGALDQKNSSQLMKIFHELHAMGKTIIIVTHDMGVANQSERIVQIVDGKIQN